MRPVFSAQHGSGSKSAICRVFSWWLVAVGLFLLSNEPSSKLAAGQLEAVGAVLSVVPVTSILATAGLVGVKLAALSRLLQALGYDRAYLAQGGSGTAAQPIGLQTNYAYMFPYVPGLNISVKGEHGTNYRNPALQAHDGNKGGSGRKTYPAMGLPGDYEGQSKPFRGSETLREIFKNAGIQMHLPSGQQQQQIQQQLQIPPQGKHDHPNRIESESKRPQSKSQQSAPVSVQANTQTDHHQFNVHHHGHQQPPPPSNLQNLNNNAPTAASNPPLELPTSPSMSADHQLPPSSANLAANHHQPVSEPSSSSSPMGSDPLIQAPADNTRPSPGVSSSSIQVNMPQPKLDHFGLPPVSIQLPVPLATQPASQMSPAPPQLQPPASSPPPQLAVGSLNVADQLPVQPPTVLAIGHIAPIPQHYQFTSHMLTLNQQGAGPKRKADPLPTGKIARPPVESPPKPLRTFEDIRSYYFPSARPLAQYMTSVIPLALRPQKFQAPQQPLRATADVSIDDGLGNISNEITTNILPRPFDELPTTLSTDDHNELDRVQQRRKKRSPSSTILNIEPGKPSGRQQGLAGLLDQAALTLDENQQPAGGNSAQTFGMPAQNIHSIRRKRQSSGTSASRLLWSRINFTH